MFLNIMKTMLILVKRVFSIIIFSTCYYIIGELSSNKQKDSRSVRGHHTNSRPASPLDNCHVKE